MQPYLLHNERKTLRADTLLYPHPDRGEISTPMETRITHQWRQAILAVIEKVR